MSSKQQATMPESMMKLFPSTVVLPKIGRRYAREGLSSVRLLDLEAFLQFDGPMVLKDQSLSKSNILRNSNVKLCPLPKTTLLNYENMEKLLELKTVAFREDKDKQQCSLLRGAKHLNDTDTSAQSLSNKASLKREERQGRDCETIYSPIYGSCRIINSKKIPFKIHQNPTERPIRVRSRSLWSVSRIQSKQHEQLSTSFTDEIGDLIKQF